MLLVIKVSLISLPFFNLYSLFLTVRAYKRLSLIVVARERKTSDCFALPKFQDINDLATQTDNLAWLQGLQKSLLNVFSECAVTEQFYIGRFSVFYLPATFYPRREEHVMSWD